MKNILRVRPKIKDNTFVTYGSLHDSRSAWTDVSIRNVYWSDESPTPMTEDGPYQEPINNAIFRALLNELLSPYNVRIEKYEFGHLSLAIWFRVGDEPRCRFCVNLTPEFRDLHEGPKAFARAVALEAANCKIK